MVGHSVKKVLLLSCVLLCQTVPLNSILRSLPLNLKYFSMKIESKTKSLLRLKEKETTIPPEKCNFIPEDFERTGRIPKLEELVLNLGYPIETHSVETEDGYLLTLFRIKHGKKDLDDANKIRKPVMLQHGLLDSAAAFLATPTGLAYFLADRGYDVWIGNSRGTLFSRQHKDKERDPDKKGTTYWEFSFHEMGVYDLPACLRKIRDNTEGNQRIHYIGMSMGTTQFFVMASELPLYLNWIDCVILMAPVARPTHMDLLSGVKYYLNWGYFNMMQSLTDGEVCIYRAKLSASVYRFCSSKGTKQRVCEKIMRSLAKPKTGYDLYDFESTRNVYLYSPSGASAMIFLHYLQIANSGNFQKFDFGKSKNKVLYKNKNPPAYNLKNLNKKLFLMVGGSDNIASEKDVKWLQENLPSSEVLSKNFEFFTHRDFHFSVNIEQTLYNVILDTLTSWESVQKVPSE